MNAPTLWEEGRWSGSRVTRFSVLLCVLLAGLDLLVTQRISLVFDIGFALVCLLAALAVRPQDFFRVGVLPPLLLLGCAVVLSLVARGAVADQGNGYVQGVISALAHSASGLMAGYVLVLLVLAIRHHVIGRRALAGSSPGSDHSNREASPAPYRVISGAPPEKSTTVVGDGTTSPASITASNQ